MKVLLLTHGRSGSTSLHFALSEVLGLNKIIEPFNVELWRDYYNSPLPLNEDEDIPDNTIIKTIAYHNDNWVYQKYNQFDKIILLVRENIREVMISAENAPVYGYHNKYEATEEPNNKFRNHFVSAAYTKIFEFNENLNANFIWYGDIFTDFETCKKTIYSLSFPNIDDNKIKLMWDKYFDPKHRLREI
jgi:hypothetical protein